MTIITVDIPLGDFYPNLTFVTIATWPMTTKIKTITHVKANGAPPAKAPSVRIF